MKSCNRCQKTKPLLEFSKASTCKDGHRNYCKSCQSLKKAAWYAENKEHVFAKTAEWVKKNPEQRKLIAKRCQDKHKDAYALTRQEWGRVNKSKVNLSTALRRRRLREATPAWIARSCFIPIYQEAQNKGLEVDHIVPLIHDKVCGLHVPWNLQLLTKSENSSKSNTFNEEALTCLI